MYLQNYSLNQLLTIIPFSIWCKSYKHLISFWYNFLNKDLFIILFTKRTCKILLISKCCVTISKIQSMRKFSINSSNSVPLKLWNMTHWPKACQCSNNAPSILLFRRMNLSHAAGYPDWGLYGFPYPLRQILPWTEKGSNHLFQIYIYPPIKIFQLISWYI